MNFNYSFNKSLIEQNLADIELERTAVKNMKGIGYWLYLLGF